MPVLAIAAGALTIAALLGDAAQAAGIAGAFTVFNTALNLWIARKVEHVQRAIVSPRRLIFDEHGEPIGTVLDLRRDPMFERAMVAAGRRIDDDSGPRFGRSHGR